MTGRAEEEPHLEGEYAAAWDEWAASGEQAVWDVTSADGLDGIAAQR